MTEFERQCREACELLREDIVFDCLFKNPEAYSKKALGRGRAKWDRLPSGEPKGRLIPRGGKLFKVCVPVEVFYRFGAARGLQPSILRDFFPQEVTALKPKNGQALCYAVNIEQGRDKQ